MDVIVDSIDFQRDAAQGTDGSAHIAVDAVTNIRMYVTFAVLGRKENVIEQIGIRVCHDNTKLSGLAFCEDFCRPPQNPGGL